MSSFKMKEDELSVLSLQAIPKLETSPKKLNYMRVNV
jgi:hypothetical protein